LVLRFRTPLHYFSQLYHREFFVGFIFKSHKSKVPEIAFLCGCCTSVRYKFQLSRLSWYFPIRVIVPISSIIVPAGLGKINFVRRNSYASFLVNRVAVIKLLRPS
jgi:hypothetical protein